jgi:hypothetical protein
MRLGKKETAVERASNSVPAPDQRPRSANPTRKAMMDESVIESKFFTPPGPDGGRKIGISPTQFFNAFGRVKVNPFLVLSILPSLRLRS